jgi:hypothetical protein
MNKKNISIVALAIFLAGSVSAYDMQSISVRDAYVIRKDLQEKYAQGLLNEVHLMEKDATFVEVLDRDIFIMEYHKINLMQRISSYKGVFARTIVPTFKSLGASIWAGTSIGSLCLAIVSKTMVDDLRNGNGNLDIKGNDFFFNLASKLGAINRMDTFKYVYAKEEELAKRHPEYPLMVMATPIAGAISLISGLLFIKSVVSLYKYSGKLDEAIMKLKKRVDRDNAIIGRLKELRYQAIQQ